VNGQAKAERGYPGPTQGMGLTLIYKTTVFYIYICFCTKIYFTDAYYCTSLFMVLQKRTEDILEYYLWFQFCNRHH